MYHFPPLSEARWYCICITFHHSVWPGDIIYVSPPLSEARWYYICITFHHSVRPGDIIYVSLSTTQWGQVILYMYLFPPHSKARWYCICTTFHHSMRQGDIIYTCITFQHSMRAGHLYIWNLYKAASKLCGLSRRVVFHNRENKHDFVKTVPGKYVFSKTSQVSL